MDVVSQSFKELYFLKNKNKPSSPSSENKFICINCKGESFDYDSKVDESICIICGFVQHFKKRFEIYTGYLPDTFSKVKKTEYKQLEYVKLRLTELQCGVMKLDCEMIEKLKEYFKNKPLDICSLRKALNLMGYKQMYLRIPIILYTLSPEKYPPMKLTSREVCKIVNLFKQYLSKWESLTTEDKMGRKNLLNYQFVLKKIFIKLGLQDKTKFLNIPKGKKTLKQHEYIWSKLC